MLKGLSALGEEQCSAGLCVCVCVCVVCVAGHNWTVQDSVFWHALLEGGARWDTMLWGEAAGNGSRT